MIERHVDLNHLALTRNMAYVYVLSQWIDLLGLGNLSALQQGVQRVPNKSSAYHDSDKAAQAKSDANTNMTFFSRPIFCQLSYASQFQLGQPSNDQASQGYQDERV